MRVAVLARMCAAKRTKSPSSASLERYVAKRDFTRTPEPAADAHARQRKTPARVTRASERSSPPTRRFFVQRHAARRLHYDVRLEHAGVLKSWAVPKGPSLDPAEKRLAVRTEDHPLDYGAFEGTIPRDQYGAGDVLLWDRGVWSPSGDVEAGLARGKLEFRLDGVKMHGHWKLVRMRGSGAANGDGEPWLLLKADDAYAARGDAADLPTLRPESVAVAAPVRAQARTPQRQRGRAVTALPPLRSPQLATLVDTAPADDGWMYEVKYDGYRMLARIEAGGARLLSRNGRDWGARAPGVVAALGALPTLAGGPCWIDGELVVFDAAGRSSFQRLQNALDGGGRGRDIVYVVFDVLFAEGLDVASRPLAERLQVLDRLIPPSATAGAIRRAQHVRGDGRKAVSAACRLGLEGLIGKRLDAPYSFGRSRTWIKLKCASRDEFVIGGWSEGARSGFGALLVGTFVGDGRLDYAGRVGTGFDAAAVAMLERRFAPLAAADSPFRGKLPGRTRWRNGAGAVHWLRPRLVCEVSYAERTDEGLLRHAVFHGLREDKDARTVQPEPVRRVAEATGASVAGVTITHPDRILVADVGLTKLELARYYAAVGEHIVRHIEGRPLSLLRCPDGANGQCFFQKHMETALPRALTTVQGPGEHRPYLLARDVEGVVSLVQRGVIELHTWGARAPRLGAPDRITMDLDPHAAVTWAQLVEAAHLVRGLLGELGLASFVKTTGGKGLHVVAPIRANLDWESVKAFARAAALLLSRTFPERFTATVSKAKRTDRIFVDYLRNGEGATAIAAFAVRARPGAPVSTPIAWDELDARHDLRAAYFNVRNVPGRLAAARDDPWADYWRTRQALTRAARERVDA